MSNVEIQHPTVERVESQAEILEFQELACEIIRQAWLDAGDHRPGTSGPAVAFALSRDFDLWCELAELSEATQERIRLAIELRAEVGLARRRVQSLRRSQLRAG